MSSRYPILDNRPIDQWKVTELKEELKRRKLVTKGLKEDLVKRLFESITKDSELDNGDSGQQDMHSDDLEDPDCIGEAQVEKDELELTGKGSEQAYEDSAIVDDDGTHPDTPMVDQINDHTIEAISQDKKQTDNDISSVEEDDVDAEPCEDENPNKDSMINEVLAVTANEVIPSEDFVQNDGNNFNMSVLEPHNQDSYPVQKNEIQQLPNNSASDLSEPKNEVPETKLHRSASLSPSHLDQTFQISERDESDNNKELRSEDAMLEQVEHNDQVSEVEPNLGFKVSCALINSDSVSINKKNELKDNLNANDFPLEIEVSKLEAVHSSSSDVAPVGGELQPMDSVHEPGFNPEFPDEMDVSLRAKDSSPEKKTDTADAGYSEKLSLDRSSGEESMEEDLSETKQIETLEKPDEGEDKISVNKLHEEGSRVEAGASPSSLEVVKEDSPPTINADKRKNEVSSDMLRANEPTKRQRRWFSEPLMVPEHLPTITTSITPKAPVLLTPKHSFTRSDSVVTGESPKERIVPPPQRTPTSSLRIDRFLRPFTLKQVHELLGKTGTVCSFWMDNIKTHCYVTYSSEEEAIATRNAVYNLQWPVNGGRLLIADFVDPQEVKSRIEAPPESPAIISPGPKTPSAPPQVQASHFPVRQFAVPKPQLPPPPPLPTPPVLLDPPNLKERQQLPPPPKKKPETPKSEPPVLTLDDLFMKTKATPRIYYLPLSDEHVAAKLAAQAKVAGD